ncbi:hypothetical protein ACFC3F_02605 [Microbacterium sp. NPDC055910]|uniref:hypothetical protein n=1 Tax=Microbacterium sp. NPDC055910 TaxID=3345659 RepID=UPI0035E3587A
MAVSDREIESFLNDYQDGLGTYDVARSVALWGVPGTILSDPFVGTVSSREEMAQGLEQSYPLYRQLGLKRVEHTLLERVDLTAAITRLRVRWHFYGAGDELLTDGDYEYLLRRDEEGLRMYVAVSIDEAEKIAELAARKGVELPDAGS